MVDPVKATASLARYLADSGFLNLYRYIVSVNAYAVTPAAIHAGSAPAVCATDTYVDGSLRGRQLLWTLMAQRTVALPELTPHERALAEELVEAGLLRRDGDGVAGAGYQLIAVDDVPLLIDAAINFPRGRRHDVYIGVDTMLLLYYLGAGGLEPGARFLDLCTGTGVIGLVAARAGASVVSTDIAEKPLLLANLNRVLAGLEARVEVRREDIKDSLVSGQRWDVVTCNPPFVAAPPELELPIFARGPGLDGLDMMRDLLAALDNLLSERGQALLVADLVGDDKLPFLVKELGALAERLCVEVYIDRRLPAEQHATALGHILVARNVGLELEAALARARAFILGELGAKNLFLTVVRVRRGPPGLLVLNRYRAA